MNKKSNSEREIRRYRVSISKGGNVIYTTVSVQSPAGLAAAKELAESMYGGPGVIIQLSEMF